MSVEIRSYCPSDLEAIKRIHEASGLDYRFPNMNQFPVHKVLEVEGTLRVAYGMRHAVECYLWLDSSGWTDAAGKWAAIKALNREATEAARDLGIDIDELWAGYDPRKEPLEVQVVHQWQHEYAGQSMTVQMLVYTVGTFKGVKSRMGAYFALPDRRTGRMPGIVQMHGGGQRAARETVEAAAANGYACVAVNWGGRKLEDQQPGEPGTDWGAMDATQTAHNDHFHVLTPDSRTLDAVVSPRNSNWFPIVMAARRALTLLEQRPEVDPERLGVEGHSMGGKLTVMTAGVDAAHQGGRAVVRRNGPCPAAADPAGRGHPPAERRAALLPDDRRSAGDSPHHVSDSLSRAAQRFQRQPGRPVRELAGDAVAVGALQRFAAFEPPAHSGGRLRRAALFRRGAQGRRQLSRDAAIERRTEDRGRRARGHARTGPAGRGGAGRHLLQCQSPRPDALLAHGGDGEERPHVVGPVPGDEHGSAAVRHGQCLLSVAERDHWPAVEQAFSQDVPGQLVGARFRSRGVEGGGREGGRRHANGCSRRPSTRGRTGIGWSRTTPTIPSASRGRSPIRNGAAPTAPGSSWRSSNRAAASWLSLLR